MASVAPPQSRPVTKKGEPVWEIAYFGTSQQATCVLLDGFVVDINAVFAVADPKREK